MMPSLTETEASTAKQAKAITRNITPPIITKSSHESTAEAHSEGSDSTKPRRPLSAYNFFFKINRQQILQTSKVRPEGKPRRSHGKIGFAELARTVAKRWRSASTEERAYYEEQAYQDKVRYNTEMEEWKAKAEHPQGMKNVYTESVHPSQPTSCPQISPNVITPSARERSIVRPPASVVNGNSTSVTFPNLEPGLPAELENYYQRRVSQFCQSERQRLVNLVRQHDRLQEELNQMEQDLANYQDDDATSCADIFAEWPEPDDNEEGTAEASCATPKVESNKPNVPQSANVTGTTEEVKQTDSTAHTPPPSIGLQYRPEHVAATHWNAWSSWNPHADCPYPPHGMM